MTWHNCKKNGFTLFELIVVIAILMALSTIALPYFTAYKQRGYDSQANADAKNFYTACVTESLHTNTDKVYNAANLPDGYNGSPPISGSFNYTAATGAITCDAKFKHPDGATTYSLDNNGNISFSF